MNAIRLITNILYIPILFAVLIFSACTGTQKTSSYPAGSESIELPAAVEKPDLPYRSTEKRVFDLLHTSLQVSFNPEKRTMDGTADLILKPYFFTQRACTLDAQGMAVKSIMDINSNSALPFLNNGETLVIDIKKNYSRTDTLKIRIEYTAKPDELKTKEGNAITNNKGLYFINHDGKDINKPQQIWTHGEPESNSVWFPTIDSPNERMTQEIAITVEDRFITLSNGVLVYSEENGDGTRTDYWEQKLPDAPYLTMMAIGEYSVVKDSWRGIDVDYYVEPEFEPYAKMIFGNTPEMLTFFSNKLGVDYPWEKCAQVVVRDFVSGAMENTGAIVYGEFLQRNPNQLIDENYEDFLAHELMHQWFGNIVTCESWSNIPLNEAFATYGEYLWNEFKYGIDEADYYGMIDLNAYLRESESKQVDMIRYKYEEIDDMFDAHSYQKGGRILHYLRHYMGDEAFFASLKLYLTKHAYQAVEIHDLRLAFEEVSGEDLNWFFNQWFLSSGHPYITVDYSYDSLTYNQEVTISQRHSFNSNFLYKLPLDIVLSVNNKIRKHRVVLNEKTQKFSFRSKAVPEMVLVDPGNHLPGVMEDNKTFDAFKYQYYNSPHYLGRIRALRALPSSSEEENEQDLVKLIFDASRDPFWHIRYTSVEYLQELPEADSAQVKKTLIFMALRDNNPKVRSEALYGLGARFNEDKELAAVYERALNDSSYAVFAEALENYSELEPEKGLGIARKLTDNKTGDIKSIVANILAQHGDDSDHEFFIKALRTTSGPDQFEIVTLYGEYLKNNSAYTMLKGIPFLQGIGINGKPWWVRFAAMDALSNMKEEMENKLKNEKLSEEEKLNYEKSKSMLMKAIEKIKVEEKNPRLIKSYNRS